MNWESKIQGLKNILIQLLKSQILPSDSYLAGGTALYYYLHHRLSVDLDFFTQKSFNPEMLVFKLREEFGTANVEIMGKDQIPYFDVRDQEEAYRELIERLIHELTRDFRPTKRRL